MHIYAFLPVRKELWLFAVKKEAPHEKI